MLGSSSKLITHSWEFSSWFLGNLCWFVMPSLGSACPVPCAGHIANEVRSYASASILILTSPLYPYLCSSEKGCRTSGEKLAKCTLKAASIRPFNAHGSSLIFVFSFFNVKAKSFVFLLSPRQGFRILQRR